MDSNSLFICPLCGGALTREQHTYKCAAGHSFDRAAQGYVHLLPANRKHTAEPGDDRAMVAARAAFLARGYYTALRDRLCDLAVDYAPDDAVLVDSGCGEGYYTAGVTAALAAAGKHPRTAGIDISKAAAKLAARQCPDTEIAVASAFRLPLADGCTDILLNCFSPLCLDEFRRILRTGGVFFYIVPASRHLWQMKEVLYESPYENEAIEADYDGFRYVGIKRVRDTVVLENAKDIGALFSMTPYAWKTPRAGRERLAALAVLETEIGFDIHIYERTKE